MIINSHLKQEKKKITWMRMKKKCKKISLRNKTEQKKIVFYLNVDEKWTYTINIYTLPGSLAGAINDNKLICNAVE